VAETRLTAQEVEDVIAWLRAAGGDAESAAE
jgi:hypothetical protein